MDIQTALQNLQLALGAQRNANLRGLDVAREQGLTQLQAGNFGNGLGRSTLFRRGAQDIDSEQIQDRAEQEGLYLQNRISASQSIQPFLDQIAEYNIASTELDGLY